MKAELAEIKRELEIRKLLRLRSELAAIKAELALRQLLRTAKAYNPNQPRVPAGSREGGQWTNGSGGTLSRQRDNLTNHAPASGQRTRKEIETAIGGGSFDALKSRLRDEDAVRKHVAQLAMK